MSESQVGQKSAVDEVNNRRGNEYKSTLKDQNVAADKLYDTSNIYQKNNVVGMVGIISSYASVLLLLLLVILLEHGHVMKDKHTNHNKLYNGRSTGQENDVVRSNNEKEDTEKFGKHGMIKLLSYLVKWKSILDWLVSKWVYYHK